MTPATCPRMFEVEALRDGRLGGAERMSFQRHIQSCAVCAREAAALDKLAEEALVGLDDARSADELHVWRERSRLLAAFDRSVTSPTRTSRTARLLLWPAATAAAIALLVALGRPRPVAEPMLTARAAIEANGPAVWSRRPGAADREEVTLERGALWIHVDHHAGERGVVVVLPDGEVEDVGTTFTVSADGKQTTRVEVVEGKVALRLHGRPSVEIEAGSVWLPEASAAPPPATTAPPFQTEPFRDKDPPSTHGRVRPLHSYQAPVVASPDPLVEFRSASAALRTGHNSEAAATFARFLADHPGDPMAEDAAYLRVIALQRTGGNGETKRAAQAYLERFPSGFRRAEIERLAR
jgi:hypothetical protein